MNTKKARNFLAKDGPGSFDQPDVINIPNFRFIVKLLPFWNTETEKIMAFEGIWAENKDFAVASLICFSCFYLSLGRK